MKTTETARSIHPIRKEFADLMRLPDGSDAIGKAQALLAELHRSLETAEEDAGDTIATARRLSEALATLAGLLWAFAHEAEWGCITDHALPPTTATLHLLRFRAEIARAAVLEITERVEALAPETWSGKVPPAGGVDPVMEVLDFLRDAERNHRAVGKVLARVRQAVEAVGLEDVLA